MFYRDVRISTLMYSGEFYVVEAAKVNRTHRAKYLLFANKLSKNGYYLGPLVKEG